MKEASSTECKVTKRVVERTGMVTSWIWMSVRNEDIGSRRETSKNFEDLNQTFKHWNGRQQMIEGLVRWKSVLFCRKRWKKIANLTTNTGFVTVTAWCHLVCAPFLIRPRKIIVWLYFKRLKKTGSVVVVVFFFSNFQKIFWVHIWWF